MTRVAEWLRRAEAQLDEWGKPAWLIAMVLGFILAWPIGLFILGYMIWSGRMGCKSSGWSFGRGKKERHGTGNTAFDAYRDETLRRLEDEQTAFRDFLGRLRQAKDQAEFDQFMAERRDGGNVQPAS